MLEIYRELSKEIYPIDNPTLGRVTDHLKDNGSAFGFVKHPEKTRTVAEKEEMIRQNPSLYSILRGIVIVKGSALTYHYPENEESHVAHFNAGQSRINMKMLKKELGIPKKRDLRFYQGDLVELIGLQSGEVSPLMPTLDKVAAVTFDSDLLDTAKMSYMSAHSYVFDMAVTQEISLFANVNEVYNALLDILGENKVKIVEKKTKQN